jgi:starvation-inducible DNA-binding protein
MQANAFIFYTKAHGYHWNVEGILFKQFHSFFEEIYSDVWESVDDYAEWLRRLSVPAPFDVLEVFQTSNLEYDAPTNAPIEMLRTLGESNDILIRDLMMGFDCATQANEQGLANFIAERIDQHEKFRWQINASMKTIIN